MSDYHPMPKADLDRWLTTEPEPIGEDLDGMQIATDELAAEMVPLPEDVLENVGPLACLWYTTQLAVFTMGRFVGTINSPEGADVTDDDGPVRALAAITEAVGNLYGACMAVDILGPEAVWTKP